ncbi:merozoite surface protein 7 (MSP7), putative [Plasmodium ovale wallikeri]|uniref:MSP7-like protein, putative n=2 Tax=Plasmodium ovale TaxID=36330 RepID=A0A1C3KV65_PLAOA|nr:merozoite surface protein 7 (MSP7), putative [Plasmodium ovale wallikeri]SBT78074.1 MSP7-like protein, putative [Plasmodium ovale]
MNRKRLLFFSFFFLLRCISSEKNPPNTKINNYDETIKKLKEKLEYINKIMAGDKVPPHFKENFELLKKKIEQLEKYKKEQETDNASVALENETEEVLDEEEEEEEEVEGGGEGDGEGDGDEEADVLEDLDDNDDELEQGKNLFLGQNNKVSLSQPDEDVTENDEFEQEENEGDTDMDADIESDTDMDDFTFPLSNETPSDEGNMLFNYLAKGPVQTKQEGEKALPQLGLIPAPVHTMGDRFPKDYKRPSPQSAAAKPAAAKPATAKPVATKPVAAKPEQEQTGAKAGQGGSSDGNQEPSSGTTSTKEVKQLDKFCDDILKDTDITKEVATYGGKFDKFKKEFSAFTMNQTEYNLVKKIVENLAKNGKEESKHATAVADVFKKAFTNDEAFEEMKNIMYGIYGYSKRHTYIQSKKIDDSSYKSLFDNVVNLLDTTLTNVNSKQ